MRPLGFVHGAGSLVAAAGLLLTRPRLWPYAVLPVGLTACLFAALAWGAIYGIGAWTDSLTAGDWGWFDWVKSVVSVVLPVLVAVAVIAIAYFTFTVIATAVASPFLDILSAHTEAILTTGQAPDPGGGSFFGDSLRSVGDAIRLLLLQVAVLVLSFPLNFVPVVGTAAWVAIGAWMTAFDYFDFPLVRHRYAWGERWAFLRRNAGTALGFGLATFGLLLVPFLNLLILPIATIAATRLHHAVTGRPLA